MELIDRAALGVGRCSKDVLPAAYCAGWNGMLNIINDAPTIDAVPKEITLLRTGDGMREYTFPKKWIKVRAPKELSDEQREKMANRARERFGFQKNGETL